MDVSEDERQLDRAFLALADPIRRAIVARLSRGPATVNELAEPFEVTTQAVSRHIRVLEEAGLVTRSRDAQRRPVHLAPEALERLTSWIDGYRLAHEQNYRALDRVLGTITASKKEKGIMTNPVAITAPEGLPFIEIEREFEAPPEAVLEAHRDPELVKRWLGPRGYEMEIDTWDFQTGGRYRYTHHTPDQGSFSFFGSFHSVSPELLIQTFEFEGVPGIAAIESMRIEPLDGGARTRIRIHSAYPSLEARDGMVESGMETGVVQGYEQLDDVLADRPSR